MMGGTRFPAMVMCFTKEPSETNDQMRKQPWEKNEVRVVSHLIQFWVLPQSLCANVCSPAREGKGKPKKAPLVH